MSSSEIARDRGELAIVLHSHMPYVEGFGTWPFGEEWLFEAMAVCYLPLIEMLERWAEDDHAVATVGVTPVLADQLAVAAVGQRFLRFVGETRADCHRLDFEGLRKDGQDQAADALAGSLRDYERAAERFEQLSGEILPALRSLREHGTVELWTSAATHAVLPLLETEAGMRLQVRSGVASHRERFGRWSGGFWLPECAYRPGLDAQLADAGVRAFCVDQTRHASDLDQLEPVSTAAGPTAIPIDWRTIELVWSGHGYPASPVYRDYHAHTINGMRPWANSGAPYQHELGAEQARTHAREFVASVADRLQRYREQRGRPGLLVCALDTELLGHWWYEGLTWLDAVIREAASAGVALSKLPEALERHDPIERPLHESSWGTDKDLSTWDSPAVEQLRWSATTAELALAGALPAIKGNGNRAAAARAARELLAMQSSDWAFMEARALAADYPVRRVRDHAAAFATALAESTQKMKDSRPMPPGSSPEQAASPVSPSLDATLQGLAPSLDMSGLLEPASPWGRQSPSSKSDGGR